MLAVRVHEPGHLTFEAAGVPLPVPPAGEVLVRNCYAGVNYIDTYHVENREFYQLPRPFVPGVEGAGVIAQTGQRVAYVLPRRTGAYAAYTSVPAHLCVPVPAAMSLAEAVAVLLQGLTAHALATSVVSLAPHSTVLVHAAAGGCGRLLTHMLSRRGHRVLATCSDSKRAAARAAGAAEAFAYDDFPAAVDTATQGAGVAAVFDGVGQATLLGGLQCLSPRGTMVLYGAASGPVAPFDPMLLARKSLFLTRPTVWSYIASPAEFVARAAAVMADVRGETAAGKRQCWQPNYVLPLSDAAQAHALLRGRQSIGKIVLKIADE